MVAKNEDGGGGEVMGSGDQCSEEALRVVEDRRWATIGGSYSSSIGAKVADEKQGKGNSSMIVSVTLSTSMMAKCRWVIRTRRFGASHRGRL